MTARKYAIALALAAAAVATLRPVLFAHGTPAFVHDWSWPLTPDALRHFALSLSAPIGDGNWNEPAWLPRLNPAQLVLALLSYVVAPAAALKIYVLGILLLAGWGAFRLTKSLGATAFGAATAAAFFIAAPTVVDKLVAGHLFLLLAYAALPHALEAALSRRGWPAYVLWFGLTSFDIHFFGFDILGLLALQVAGKRIDRAAYAGLALFLPSIAGALFGAQSGAFQDQHTTDLYNIVNSSQLRDAVRDVGYYTGYDAIGRTWLVDAALWIGPLCALLCALRKQWVPVVLFSTGAVLAAGVNTPAWFVLRPLYDHLSAASVYREFYDFSVLTALGVALAIGLGPRGRERWIAAAITLAAVLPALSGSYGVLVKPWAPAARDVATLQRIEREPGDALVQLVPMQRPLGPAGYAGGADPVGTSIGEHGTVNSFFDVVPVGRYASTLPAATAGEIRAELGIGAQLERPGWESHAVARLEPNFRIPAPPARNEPEGAWTVRSQPVRPAAGFVDERRCAAGDFERLSPHTAVIFAALEPACGGTKLDAAVPARPYPRLGWVPYNQVWYAVPWGAAALPGALVTTAANLSYPLPVGCDPAQRYRYDVIVLRARGGATERAVELRGCRPPVTAGPTVISGIIRTGGLPESTSPAAPGSARISSSGNWWYRIDGSLTGTSLLRIRSAYSPFWTMSVRGSARAMRHVRTDATFNGWEMDGNGPFTAYVFYTPALAIVALELCAALAYLAAFAVWVRRMARRTHTEAAPHAVA